MIWERIKKGLLITIGLIILLPIFFYIISINWSNSHTARIDALPILTNRVDNGEYRLHANDLEFYVRVGGMQNKGPGVILLHGFPESSIVWKPLIDSAAANGYRVVAFDQRGYSPNARPKGIENYEIHHLVQDVIAVADQVGLDTFHLVGHDWGSAVGWKVVMDHPDRIHTYTAMAVPHVGAFFEGILNDPEQQKRSDYMNKLRIPILPELLIQIFKNRIFKGLEGRWHPHEIKEYMDIHSEHGASTAALNWYRAMDYEDQELLESLNKKVTRSTLFLYGEHDPIVSEFVVKKQPSYMEAPLKSIKLDVGHSVMQEAEDRVLKEIMEHWSKHK